MTRPIRPDVHARFLALVARVDAEVKNERLETQKRSSKLLPHEARQGARAIDASGPTSGPLRA